MIKFILQPYLLACYCFTKAIEEKSVNREKNINAFIAHIFTGPFNFILLGIYSSVIGLYTKGLNHNLVVWVFPFLIILPFGYWLFGWTEKTIDRWGIPQQWEALEKWKRGLYILFGIIFFWGGFALFFYVTIKFFAGYGLRR